MAKTDEEIVLEISAQIGPLKADLAAAKKSIKGFENNFKKAGREVDKTAKKLNSAGKGFRGSTEGMLGASKKIRAEFGALKFAILPVTIALVGAGVALNATAQRFRELDRAARRLDIPVEEFSKFAVVARKSGVDVETLGDAMKDLNVKITDASMGAKAYEDVFRSIGLQSSELVKLPVAEQFLKFSDAIKRADQNTRRFALDEINDAMFQMIPLMEQGGDKIRIMAEEAERMGQSVSKSEADKMRKYNKAMTELGLAAENLANALAEHVVPALTEVATAVTSAVNGLAEIISSSDELTEALRKTRVEAMEAVKAFQAGEAISSSGAIAMGQYSGEVDKATVSLDALATAGESLGLDPFKNADASGFALPTVSNPEDQEQDLNMMFSQNLQGDNGGGSGGALARLIEDNDRKKEIAIEHAAEMLSLDFELALVAGEQKEAARLREEESHQLWLDRMFGAEKRAADQNNKLWASGLEGKRQVTSKVLGQISGLMNTNSKKQFQIGKMAAMAQVAIDTPKAAMSAYSSMAGIPIVGPALGVAAAAAAVASGASQMQNIKSQTFGGGGGASGAGISAGGATAQAGQAAPENVIDASFNITGQSVGTDQVRSMLGGLNELLEDGGKLRTITMI